MNKLNWAILFLCTWFLSCTKAPDSLVPAQEFLEPKPSIGYQIKHSYYTISYSNINRQAEFVFYYLTPQSIKGGAKRTDNFRIDPFVKDNPVSGNAYVGCGFDRGHLCPAADMALNETAMSETFYMSNISPMTPTFNRGIWSKLEDWFRVNALANGGMYVATGPILNGQCGSIPGAITIPCAFYKIAFQQGTNPKMIGFILNNSGSSNSLKSFAVSVDEIEKKTGIDFFPQLEDTIENQLESKVNLNSWNL